jgi:ABC-type Fe3+ transport system substrate-binding protein
MRSIGFAATFLALSACGGGQHLKAGHGDSYLKAFAVQQERTGKPPAVAVVGLDAQEAGITTDNYRGTLAPKGKEAKEEPVLIVAPPSREQPMRPAPSVPKE